MLLPSVITSNWDMDVTRGDRGWNDQSHGRTKDRPTCGVSSYAVSSTSHTMLCDYICFVEVIYLHLLLLCEVIGATAYPCSHWVVPDS